MFLKTRSIPAFIIRHQQDDAAIGSQSEEDLYIRTIELLGNGNQILFRNSVSGHEIAIRSTYFLFNNGRKRMGWFYAYDL